MNESSTELAQAMNEELKQETAVEKEEREHNNRAEATKTYVEQTKLLVTLASAFLVAPAGLLALDPTKVGTLRQHVCGMIMAEGLFILSVLTGYVVLATVVGSQDDGSFNVYRGATRFWSILQFAAYVLGLFGFVWLVIQIAAT